MTECKGGPWRFGTDLSVIFFLWEEGSHQMRKYRGNRCRVPGRAWALSRGKRQAYNTDKWGLCTARRMGLASHTDWEIKVLSDPHLAKEMHQLS